MQNAKIFRVMFSSIQNTEFFVVMKPLEAHFGFFWPLEPKSKMESNYPFAKKFAWSLVLFCNMMDQNPKFFGKQKGTKHPLKINVFLVNGYLNYFIKKEPDRSYIEINI